MRRGSAVGAARRPGRGFTARGAAARTRIAVVLATALALAALEVTGVSADQPPAAKPSLEQVRKEMGIPSEGVSLRGIKDTVGFAARAAQMARAWEAGASPPAPDRLGPAPDSGVVAVIGPHDDYVYAGRVYREVYPRLAAKTVVLIGVFHGYRKFGARDLLVFDPYRAWRTPDGPVPVSQLREAILGGMLPSEAVQDAAMHDSEHSLEPLVSWLRHARPDLEIVPIIVPAMSFERLAELADRVGQRLATAMEVRGLVLGRDVGIAISSDAVHYGADFKHTPFGRGGAAAHASAFARDSALLESLGGKLSRGKAKKLFGTFVDPGNPDEYRLTWCGRFSIPFGLLLLERLAREAGGAVGHPLVYATSMTAPGLPLKQVGLGVTAPATLEHFVGYPAAAFTLARPGRGGR